MHLYVPWFIGVRHAICCLGKARAGRTTAFDMFMVLLAVFGRKCEVIDTVVERFHLLAKLQLHRCIVMG
jgi:hypothetical membrane protein